MILYKPGAEVAQYTAAHLPDFLKKLPLYKEGKLTDALQEAFLGFDQVLTQETVIQELKTLAGVDDDENEEVEGDRIFIISKNISIYKYLHIYMPLV
jgi:hypothetical protein